MNTAHKDGRTYSTSAARSIASKRFDDDDPETPNEWEDQYFFYHYDIRGSVTAIVKPDGDSVKEYTYDEFGNVSETGSFDNEVTFTGSVTDNSTGLQYMNARYYNPTTGRFLTQDSYTGNAYEPWTQHLYSYCGNNPTNFVDPTGHRAYSQSSSSMIPMKKKSKGDFLKVNNNTLVKKLDSDDYSEERPAF